MNKLKLKNSMMSLKKGLNETKDIDIDMVYAKIKGIYPNAMEVMVEELGGTIEFNFLTGEVYEGANPSKKEMLATDKEFKEIVDVYGLSINGTISDEGVDVYADVAVKYKDKWGCVYDTTSVVSKI